MKRFISTLLTAGLVLTSCAVNEINETDFNKNGAASIFASTGNGTKTTLGENEDGVYKVYWSEGDQILVVNNDYYSSVYTSQEGGTSYAEFLPDEDSEVIDFTSGAIAGYPVQDMYLSSGDPYEPVYFTIPEIQNYVNGTFDDNIMPMISDVAYDNQLKFNNAAGVLKLMLTSPSGNVKIESVSVTATNDEEYISGECGYIPDSKSYFFDETMLSKKKVTLNCGKGVTVGSTAVPFCIVVPHQEYTGLSIRVITTDGLEQTFTMKADKVLNVQRSSVLNIPLTLDNLAPPTGPNARMTLGTVTLKGFTVSIEIQNATSYFCNLQTKESFENDLRSGYLLESLPYGTPYETPLTYSGPILNFQEEMAEVLIEPGQTYILWIVIYDENGEYTEEDIFTLEVQIKSFSPGGSIEVITTDHVVEMDMIGMNLITDGAQYIYSQLLPSEMLEDYSEQDMIDLLLKPGGMSSRAEKSTDYFERRQLRPGAELTFLAIAIDRQGRYGPLLVEEYQTIPIEYNDLIVEIEKDIDKLKENNGVLNWTVSGGEAAGYRYFFRRTDNNYWTNTFQYDYTMIQEKMVMSPGVFYINKTNDSFATLKEPSLEEGVEYVFVVLAVAADQSCSEADHWIFTY